MVATWIMRIVMALIFIMAGYGKIAVMGVENFAGAFNLPVFIAWLVALGEVGGGLGLLVGPFVGNMDPKGMLTRASGGVLALIMVGAIVLAKLDGFNEGFMAGISGMQVDLALFAMGMYFLLVGNCCGEKK